MGSSRSPARRAAEAYVAAINAADLDALIDEFAADATVLHPLGTLTGADALRSFYGDNVLAHRPALTAGGWVEQDERCVFELEATTAGRVSHAIDHLAVDSEGKVTRMAIAYR